MVLNDNLSNGDSPRPQANPHCADGFAVDIAAAQRGCPQAFDRLVAVCRPYLWSSAARCLPGELKAKVAPSDVVQETLMQARKNFPRFNGTTESELKAWLRGILVHNVQDVSRRFLGTAMRELGREVSLAADGDNRHEPIDAGIRTPSSRLVTDEETARLMAALYALPNDYRQIIVLRSFEERPFAEIAEQIERSEEAARKLWARAIDRLRSELLGGPESGDAGEF